MNLGDLPWTRAKAAIDSGRPVVAILPLGAVEAHGPHLPLITDVIISDGMARLAIHPESQSLKNERADVWGEAKDGLAAVGACLRGVAQTPSSSSVAVALTPPGLDVSSDTSPASGSQV